MRTIVDKPGTLFLGKQGENLARELAFREPALWAEEFGTGTAQLLVSPPGGPAYPIVLEEEGGLAVWRVTAADTARAGYGRCELRWSVDVDRAMTALSGHARFNPARPLREAPQSGAYSAKRASGPPTDGAVAGSLIVKSKTYVTFVAEGLSGGCGCGTDNWSVYLDQVTRAGAEALEAANRAESAAFHAPTIIDGRWWVWNPGEDGYTDTGVPARGESGGPIDPDSLGKGLAIEDGKLTVDTADDFDGDNTLPITAAAVQTVVGNIEILLGTI